MNVVYKRDTVSKSKAVSKDRQSLAKPKFESKSRESKEGLRREDDNEVTLLNETIRIQ